MNLKSSDEPVPKREGDAEDMRNQAGSSAMVHPVCGARTRAGAPCRALAMKNGRCRMHGGGSTGPKTAAGKARHRAAVTKHGDRGQHGQKLREYMRELKVRSKRIIELS